MSKTGVSMSLIVNALRGRSIRTRATRIIPHPSAAVPDAHENNHQQLFREGNGKRRDGDSWAEVDEGNPVVQMVRPIQPHNQYIRFLRTIE